jgi:hypothetical protein
VPGWVGIVPDADTNLYLLKKMKFMCFARRQSNFAQGVFMRCQKTVGGLGNFEKGK